MNTNINATDMHRVSTLNQSEGGMQIDYAGHEPEDVWAWLDRLIDKWAFPLGVGVIVILALAFVAGYFAGR
jgi:hypothetical protein